jgi:predicted AAA+ superfamily ATPase
VGARLLQIQGELYYWRENNLEVDFICRSQKTLYAIEVKSGRRKSSKGLAAFQKQFPDARPVIITTDNFAQFSEDPQAFLALVA